MPETTDKPRVKIPAEAVELYTQYIHGEISRRDFMDTIGRRFAIAGLTTAAIVEALMPNYALGQQVRKDDERIKATWETIPSPILMHWKVKLYTLCEKWRQNAPIRFYCFQAARTPLSRSII